MKYGIREICDVVLKAKNAMTVGGTSFAKGQPVLYFDTLKTSSMEGAATTVYAQGGRGNARLIAWEGERTVTFTMEDALISTTGLAILAGADIIKPSTSTPLKVHVTARYQATATTFPVEEKVYYNPTEGANIFVLELDENDDVVATGTASYTDGSGISYEKQDKNNVAKALLFDFYVLKAANATQVEITPETFGGNFYLEASTLFRDQTGKDHPAEFIIPNCKIQSNFTFNMSSSGDPSTFNFTMDAFPDYTKFDNTKKVLSVIQILNEDAPIIDKTPGADNTDDKDYTTT